MTHQPSYYLTDEAREKRLANLAENIAKDPAGYPVSVQRKVLAEVENSEQRRAA